MTDRELLKDVRRIVAEYARVNPTHSYGIGPTQDPFGAHAMLDRIDAALAAPVSTAGVYVCPGKDIICGDRPEFWCEKCPRRDAVPPAGDDARDAARYRWLRARAHYIDVEYHNNPNIVQQARDQLDRLCDKGITYAKENNKRKAARAALRAQGESK